METLQVKLVAKRHYSKSKLAREKKSTTKGKHVQWKMFARQSISYLPKEKMLSNTQTSCNCQLTRSTKPTSPLPTHSCLQLFPKNYSSTYDSPIWPTGVQSTEWKHCAGEVWQHCFTLTGVINLKAIKTRWRAAEVALTPMRAPTMPEQRFFYCYPVSNQIIANNGEKQNT